MNKSVMGFTVVASFFSGLIGGIIAVAFLDTSNQVRDGLFEVSDTVRAHSYILVDTMGRKLAELGLTSAKDNHSYQSSVNHGLSEATEDTTQHAFLAFYSLDDPWVKGEVALGWQPSGHILLHLFGRGGVSPNGEGYIQISNSQISIIKPSSLFFKDKAILAPGSLMLETDPTKPRHHPFISLGNETLVGSSPLKH